MKISLGELRKLIKESFDNEEEWVQEKTMFYSMLRNIAVENGGFLPVTHESPGENYDSIVRSGIRKQRGSHGIYFIVGWHDKPEFVTKNGIMVRVNIPARFLNPLWVVPDDRFSSGDEGYFEFIQEFPDGVGGEIGSDFDLIPRGWIKEIVRT